MQMEDSRGGPDVGIGAPRDAAAPHDAPHPPCVVPNKCRWKAAEVDQMWKTAEVDQMRERVPLVMLQQAAKGAPAARDFKAALRKKADETGEAYEAGGAACLSVLTDERYFQGSFQNLLDIRAAGVTCPLLCKEFIVEAYQVFKARARCVALVPETLVPVCACRCWLPCLLDGVDVGKKVQPRRAAMVHTEEELARVLEVPGVENHLLGINNRDLGTFKVDLGLTEKLMSSPPGQQVRKVRLTEANVIPSWTARPEAQADVSTDK
eukprot:1147751-Pelagomonas_calceolata.AAC.1